jgi:hypothetical protein
MDIVERLDEHLRFNGKDQLSRDAKRTIELLREARDMLLDINEAKDKEIAILRAEKHLTELKEGE